jgi:hypothetical protein
MGSSRCGTGRRSRRRGSLVVAAVAACAACGSGPGSEPAGPPPVPDASGSDASVHLRPPAEEGGGPFDAGVSPPDDAPSDDVGSTPPDPPETGGGDDAIVVVPPTVDSLVITAMCAASSGLPASCGDAATCTTTGDQLVVPSAPVDGAIASFVRTLGAGRHPIAAGASGFAAATVLTPPGAAPSLSLSAFAPGGGAFGGLQPLTAPSARLAGSDPVVAALACGTYAAAWTDPGDGDEVGVAVRILQPSTGLSTPLVYVNSTRSSSQHDPDVVSVGSQLVVAWVDDSSPSTAPDLRYRTFDVMSGAVSDELTLAATGDAEADVALAPFAGSWAAAWRDDASGLETIRVHAGPTDWSVGPFLPGPADGKPALAALDATHLLLVYTVGFDPAETGVADAPKVQLAVLDAAQPGSASGVDLAPLLPSAAGLAQSAPTLVSAGASAYLAWWTGAAAANPKQEELWLKELPWTGTSLGMALPEAPLPAPAMHELGDQRAPALAFSTANPIGALVSAWEDLGQTFGAGEGQGDVVAKIEPLPVSRIECSGGAAPDAGPVSCPGRVVYVSADTGNDANTGCVPCAPKRTIASALAQLQASGPADAGAGADAGPPPEVHVCAGTYNETSLVIRTPVSLLGGYDCAGWTRTATYGWPSFDGAQESVIQNAQYASQASTLVVTAPALVDGFTVRGAVEATSMSAALEVRAPLGVIVSNDHIVGGSNVPTNAATMGSIGLYLNGDVATTVAQDWIDGGSGSTTVQGVGSVGMYVLGAGADVNFPSIHDNRIGGGTGFGVFPGRAATAMAFAKAGDFRADPTRAVTRNLIDGGTGNGSTSGVIEGIAHAWATGAVFSANDIRGGTDLGGGGTTGIAWPFGSLTAIGNRIYAGNCPASTNDGSVGIQFYGSNSPGIVVNNMIHGGTSPFPLGIDLFGNGVVVAYNTIFGGSSNASQGGSAIALSTPTFGTLVAARIFNNLFMGASAINDAPVLGTVCMATTPAQVQSFQNNAILGAAVPFKYSPACATAPTGPFTIALMEQEIGKSGTASGNRILAASLCPGTGCDSACTLAAGSEGACLQSLFSAWSQNDHGFTTLVGGAWPLHGGDPCLVTRGGTVDATLGSIEQVDFFGNARTAVGPVSIGAAEFDGTCQ